MLASYLPDSFAELIHGKSVEILSEIGSCVPEQDALARLEAAGFPVDQEPQFVRVTPELLETALSSLPRDTTLYDRAGKTTAPFERAPCVVGAGTPVNVPDLETGLRCPATRQEVLPQYEMVRSTLGRFSRVAA